MVGARQKNNLGPNLHYDAEQAGYRNGSTSGLIPGTQQWGHFPAPLGGRRALDPIVYGKGHWTNNAWPHIYGRRGWDSIHVQMQHHEVLAKTQNKETMANWTHL
jgi:hypothetical protein